MEKNVLMEMIERQEKVVKEAIEHLKQLKSMLGENQDSVAISIQEEIEKKRSEIISRVEKIKADAQLQANQSMSKANSIMTNFPIKRVD